jgi:hypothetical protein
MVPWSIRSLGMRSSVQKQMRRSVVRVDHRQQCVQVVRVGRLADQDVQPARQLFARFGDGGAFVLAADAGCDVGVERLPVSAGACPSRGRPAKAASLPSTPRRR